MHKSKNGRKIWNILLLVSFIVTLLVPLTGIHIHKLASALFLLLSLIHIFMYRKGMGAKRYALIAIILVSFLTGLFGMIYEEIAFILQMHRVVSIAVVFFLAIHIFVFQKKMYLGKGR